MKEIYWIQRLDGLCTFCEALLFLSIITAVLAAITLFIFWPDGAEKIYDKPLSGSKRALIISSITAALFGTAAVFVPTSEEALIIYGVGGAIDYVQDSETLQKLPDKAVEALDLWVDSLTKEEGQR